MIMDREKLTAGAFAESIGASQATISHILSGRNKPSVELVLRVHQRYEDINLEWLLAGPLQFPHRTIRYSPRMR